MTTTAFLPRLNRTKNSLDLTRSQSIEAMPQGVVISDARRPEIPIIYCNRGFELLTGYTLAEIENRNCRFLQGPLTDPASVEEIRAAIREQRSCNVVLRNYRKDGTSFWNALTMAPIHDRRGTLTHFVGVQTDITAVKLLEEELRQTQKMEVLGQMAGTVAHDFNNLLTVIIGYSELLLDGDVPESSREECLQQIKGAGERAAALTKQLLTFSRKQPARYQAVNLNTIIREMAHILGRLLPSAEQLQLRLDDNLATVMIDPGHVEQMLLNLVVNARDASDESGIVRIHTKAIAGESELLSSRSVGPQAMLSVEDFGCGIDEASQAKIFEPFFTTKAAGQGTGIGLATVQNLVQVAGGTIRLRSKVGEGTTFDLLFPAGHAVEEERKPALTAASRGTEILLFVDDDEELREVARRMLELHGYTVLCAASLQEAAQLTMFQATTFEMLIVEQRCLNHDPAALEQLLAKTPMKVLITAASAATVDYRDISNCPIVLKPFSGQTLAQQIRQAIDGH